MAAMARAGRCTRALLLLMAMLAVVAAKQDLTKTTCPLCDMDVRPEYVAPIAGGQAIYACEMAGHIDQLRNDPKANLGKPVKVDITKDEVYKSAKEITCLVCQKGFSELKYAVPWIKEGDQKIFACSLEHANMIFDNPQQYVAASTDGTGFCKAGSKGAVMFEGFQLAMGGNTECALLLFKPWILSSGVKYAFGFIGCVLLAVFLEAFGEYREHTEARFFREYGIVSSQNDYVEIETPSQLTVSYSGKPRVLPENSHVRIIRRIPFWCKCWLAVLYMVAITIAYFLMLVIMMYESLMFFAVVLGLGIGFFVFKDTEAEKMSGNVDPCCST
ncbi:TPA: hypothetical protein N0F65_000675 [Lagenidium giganteum]|uniref:Copper transport protein n=1 Tax=Lagenidium giganteum TaxID=4803 RepID=A0AAV2YVL9_9STRA|nr:TPA: hypothetical protein N0F65_000675 [Lagenidium giganteum]